MALTTAQGKASTNDNRRGNLRIAAPHKATVPQPERTNNSTYGSEWYGRVDSESGRNAG